jgi:ketosteroid isomerase-like protein
MNDKKLLIRHTVDMTKAQNTDEIMKHREHDVNWFDITTRHLRGHDAVHEEFSMQFGKLAECAAEILEIDCNVTENLGVVISKQNFWAIHKNGKKDSMVTRQTDCFEKKGR